MFVVIYHGDGKRYLQGFCAFLHYYDTLHEEFWRPKDFDGAVDVIYIDMAIDSNEVL